MQVFVGLVVRDHLMVLLRRALARRTTANLDVTYEDLNQQFVSAAARQIIWDQHMAVLQVCKDSLLPYVHGQSGTRLLTSKPV